MGLIELGSSSALVDFIKENTSGGNGCGVVVCFSAHWCGPCKQSKPALEEFATKLNNSPKCGIVYESDIGNDVSEKYAIKGFPCYVFFGQGGVEKDRVVGVNFNGITQMISKHYNASEAKFDSTKGKTLGGTGAALTPEQARAARLARLGVVDTPMKTTATTSTTEPMDIADDDKKEKKEIETEDEPMKDAEEETATKADDGDGDAKKDDTEEEEEMWDPSDDLDKEAIATLTEGMGFLLLRAQKGLLFGATKNNVESAVEWITTHQDDADIDDPIKKVKKLTAEEKVAKIAEIKELLKAKRAEREEEEKVDHTKREIQRRSMGKEVAKTKEQLEKEQRKREGQKRKAEKLAYKRERERIRQELAKDKAERMKNKGKLGSRIGVEGYKPDGIQYDLDGGVNAPGAADDNAATSEDAAAATDDNKKEAATETTAATSNYMDVETRLKKIDEYITKVSSYRAGGDGGKCLKILKAYIGNVATDPTNTKFKTINTDNKAFKTKIKPFVGAKNIITLCGFTKESTSLVLSDENTNPELLSQTKLKLEAALAEYNK